MSDDAKCDCCGKLGRRRRFYMCPDNWMFAEISVDGTSNTIIVSICSKECALNIWKPGPGPRLTNDIKKFEKEEALLNKAKEMVSIIEVTDS